MQPALSILQLDTTFPRIPGDVACKETYTQPVEILRIRAASVAGIVRADPAHIDITPFGEALKRAEAELVVTSCGFLSFWQDHLVGLADKRFISSALTQLPALASEHSPDALMILTFDAAKLGSSHLRGHPEYLKSCVGLRTSDHLRGVIAHDQQDLDLVRAEAELLGLVKESLLSHHRAILLECTNLPPYAPAIRRATGLPVFDILTAVEAMRPGLVAPEFLSG